MKTLITTKPFSVSTEGLDIVHSKGLKKLTQQQVELELIKHSPDFIIAGTETYGAKQLNMCPDLKAISRVGVGTSSIDMEECNNRNIKVFNTPEAPTEAVAEYTVALILSMVKNLYRQDANDWCKFLAKDLSSMTIGIVGYGRIGRLVESKLRALNPKLTLICDPLYENSYLCINSIIEHSDIVTFHVPSLNSPISKEHFERMKSDVILINTSRGSIFNERDLYSFLKKNTKASAALDVFAEEPTLNKDLLDLPNTLCTPHVASFSIESRQRMESEAVKNIIDNYYTNV